MNMRFTGKLKSWNDDRGFGFITPTDGGQDIFVHISEFTEGRRPDLQATLTFEVALNPQGKKKAVNVRGPQTLIDTRRRQRNHAERTPRRTGPATGFTTGVVALLIVGSVGWWGYRQYSSRLKTPSASIATPAARQLPQTDSPAAPAFKCDGRTYCSQMTSCAEATFFLKNCSGTKMDGDGDGVPCEQQWCR